MHAAFAGPRAVWAGRMHGMHASASCSANASVASAQAKVKFDVSVYVVTDRTLAGARGVEASVSSALAGGATMVQLRDKKSTPSESAALAQSLQSLCASFGATFVVNDDLPLACTLSAGVHLGQDDATASSARPRISLLGVSAGTAAEAARALADGADYVGVGSVFGTSTKGDAGAPIGTDGLAEVVRAVGGRIPVVAIGGIGVENARACAAAGADGVAVVSAVMAAEDPEWVARRLAEEVRKGKDDFCKGRK